MPYDTRELLARLLQCEAGGEGINGMMAVATVIMNRANALTGEFARVSNGGDVRNIILRPVSLLACWNSSTAYIIRRISII